VWEGIRAGALDAGAAGSWARDMFVPAAMAITTASVVPVSRLFFASMTRWLPGNGEGLTAAERPTCGISNGGVGKKYTGCRSARKRCSRGLWPRAEVV